MKLEHRENIILYKVLNKEVVFEEYFCNLLRLDSFRRMFLKFISKKTSILNDLTIKYENFDTEIILEKAYGRADLFLEVNEKKFIFEIKNKIWTDLTPNQPEKYLKYLNNKNEHLFFLIPKGYKHKSEIIERWKDFNNIENQIFYWEDLVEEIKNTNLHLENLEINMFYEFCEYWFDLKIVEFEEEEMKLLKNKSIASMMEKLEEIIRNVSNRVGLNDNFATIGSMQTKVVGDYRVYFGIDYDIWKKNDFPLSILIQNHKKEYQEFELEIENIKLESIEYEETSISAKQFGYVVILDEEVGSIKYEKVVEKILNHVINQLKQT